jgi:L-2-hydroxyglutarate oxidase LhgO
MWREVSKGAYANELRRYIPSVRDEDLLPGPAGVRAQALALDGQLVDDFDLAGGERILHVRNAPSPAATSSLAIGSLLAKRAIEQFAL